jgi:hypothetical protein
MAACALLISVALGLLRFYAVDDPRRAAVAAAAASIQNDQEEISSLSSEIGRLAAKRHPTVVDSASLTTAQAQLARAKRNLRRDRREHAEKSQPHGPAVAWIGIPLFTFLNLTLMAITAAASFLFYLKFPDPSEVWELTAAARYLRWRRFRLWIRDVQNERRRVRLHRETRRKARTSKRQQRRLARRRERRARKDARLVERYLRAASELDAVATSLTDTLVELKGAYQASCGTAENLTRSAAQIYWSSNLRRLAKRTSARARVKDSSPMAIATACEFRRPLGLE